MRKFIVALLLMFVVGGLFADSKRVTEIGAGLQLTSDALVWAVDEDSSGRHVLPLEHHDADLTGNTAANFARSTVLVKQKKTVILAGVKAPVRLRTHTPQLYVQLTAAEQKELERTAPKNRVGYGIVRLDPVDQYRIVGRFEFSRFKGRGEYTQVLIETKQARFNDSEWLGLVPTQPLSPGEYALVQVMPRRDVYPIWIFDFGVD